MQDYLAQVEKLRKDAGECALIRDLATDKSKWEMFDRLAAHLNILADQVELDAQAKIRKRPVRLGKRQCPDHGEATQSPRNAKPGVVFTVRSLFKSRKNGAGAVA
jgi:hypothetical protein